MKVVMYGIAFHAWGWTLGAMMDGADWRVRVLSLVMGAAFGWLGATLQRRLERGAE